MDLRRLSIVGGVALLTLLLLAQHGLVRTAATALESRAAPPTPDTVLLRVFEPDVLRTFWDEAGARLPTREFVEAVQAASFSAVDGRGRQRRLVVLSIASESTFRGKGLWKLFLHNLQNITFTRRDGSQDHLARHLVANFMTLPNATADTCNRISNPYGARCVPLTSPIFTSESYGYRTAAFYGISFAKVMTILDALALGLDVFFLDSDQFFFRNPLPYILARDIDVLVTGDCGQRDDTTPADQFPKIASNIGLLYMRSTPMVVRAVYDWLHYLSRRAAESRFLLDQSTFVGSMERVSKAVGAQHMSLGMLLPDHFPHRCMAPCGCNTVGLPPGAHGRKLYRLPNTTTCKTKFVRKWYHFHVPCSGDVNDKAVTLGKLLAMYQSHVGPVNSLSEPVDVL